MCPKLLFTSSFFFPWLLTSVNVQVERGEREKHSVNFKMMLLNMFGKEEHNNQLEGDFGTVSGE